MNISIPDIIVGATLATSAQAITKWFGRQLKTDAGKVISKHIKEGHKDPLKHCYVKDCIKLGTELGSPRQAE